LRGSRAPAGSDTRLVSDMTFEAGIAPPKRSGNWPSPRRDRLRSSSRTA